MMLCVLDAVTSLYRSITDEEKLLLDLGPQEKLLTTAGGYTSLGSSRLQSKGCLLSQNWIDYSLAHLVCLYV